MATGNVNAIQVGLHHGNVIRYLAELYGDGSLVIREAVQNAIDKGAKKIFVEVDCMLKMIKVFDDGNGAGYTEISHKFQNIGLSNKLKSTESIGEKGIGNLAGIYVAEEWELLTRDASKPSDIYRLYSFKRQQLTQADGIQVYHEENPTRKNIPGAFFEARTMLRLQKVDDTTLRALKDHDVIARTLTDAFGSKLLHRKIDLRLAYKDFWGKTRTFSVKPPQYRGTAMNAERYDTKFGYVEFVFFHNVKPVSAPMLLVLHKGNYTIPLLNFCKRKILSKEVEEVLNKGHFEGEIKLGFCELNAGRDAFSPNEELNAFVEVVESFVLEVLRPLIEQLEQEGRAEKHQRIAEGILKKLRGYFSKHVSSLPQALRSFTTTVPKTSDVAEGIAGTETSKKVSPTAAKKIPQPLSPTALKEQREKSKNPGASKKRVPQMVALCEGLSLRMVYPDAEEGFNWHSRNNSGVIEINVANTMFLDAERRGQAKLSDYMSVLLEKEMTCAALNPLEAKAFGTSFEKMYMVFWRATLD